MPSLPLIVFDDPDKHHFPGATVTGHVLVKNTKPRNARSVVINWSGTSETKGVSLFQRKFKNDMFFGTELVWSSKDEQNKMPIGTYKFPFSIVLPVDCPPTFHHKKAVNEYKVQVVIDRPWKRDLKVEKEIMVTGKLEKSSEEYDSGYWVPITLRSGYFFDNGPISMVLTSDTQVYQAGDSCDLAFIFTNESSTTVSKVTVALIEEVHAHSRPNGVGCQPTRRGNCLLGWRQNCYSTRQIGKTVELQVNVPPYAEQEHSLLFKLPADLKPSFTNGLMSVGYSLRVWVYPCKLSWGHFSIETFVGEKEVEPDGKEEKDEKAEESEVQEELKEELKEQQGAPPAYIEESEQTSI